jgi:hypothetical protein
MAGINESPEADNRFAAYQPDLVLVGELHCFFQQLAEQALFRVSVAGVFRTELAQNGVAVFQLA